MYNPQPADYWVGSVRKTISSKPFFPTVGLCVLAVLAGCGTSGGRTVAPSLDAGMSAPTLDDYKAQLRDIVREEIRADRTATRGDAEIRSYKPYYFKEFHDYPEGPDSFEIRFVEQDSKTAPLAAEVVVPKVRYATDVQRDRTAVRADEDFQRERGTETVSYELRNGRWHRLASLFVASEISIMQNGQWVPRPEQPRNDFDAFEDREGWFRRTLNRLRIGDDPASGTP